MILLVTTKVSDKSILLINTETNKSTNYPRLMHKLLKKNKKLIRYAWDFLNQKLFDDVVNF